MKQTLYILFFIATRVALHAQAVDFAPVGAKWWVNQIVLDPIPADSFVIVEVTHEEIKEGELCRVITNLSGCGLPDPAYVFTRNDSVFFFSEVTEQFELLYDFTATIGSSWTVKGLNHIFGNEHTVTISDVLDVDYQGQVLKTWMLNGNFTIWGDRIVEKAGNLWYIGPTYSENCIPGQIGFMPHYVRCYEEDGALYKFGFIDCEDYDDISALEEIAEAVEFHLSPNPATTHTRLELDVRFQQDRRIQFLVLHASGWISYEGMLPPAISFYDIALEALASGVYYVLLRDDKGVQIGVKKLVITP